MITWLILGTLIVVSAAAIGFVSGMLLTAMGRDFQEEIRRDSER